MKNAEKTAPSLEDVLKAIMPDGKEGKSLPPVHLWNPDYCGDIDMVIKADGSWWHEGTRIGREKLVRLFSTILRKDDDGQTYLVTPYEKIIVTVEDAPFLAIRVDRAGEPGPDQRLVFTTNVGDFALAGADLPLRVETDPKLTRPTFYELADMAVDNPDGSDTMGVWSKGQFFVIGSGG